MESAYTIIFPVGMTVYRGINPLNNTHGSWFAYDLQDAAAYGKRIKAYKFNKEVKVINLLSNIFQMEYIDKLNLMFPGPNYNGHDINKIYALVPIGLPDSFATEYIMKKMNMPIQSPTMTPEEELYVKCMSSRYRFSNFEIDKVFSNVLNQLYSSKFSGFTLPLKSYNKFLNGYYCREIHLFDTSCVDLVEEIDILPTHSGGATMISIPEEEIQLPKIKYTKPIDLSKIHIPEPRNLPTLVPLYDPVIAEKNEVILKKMLDTFTENLAKVKQPTLNQNHTTRKQKRNGR